MHTTMLLLRLVHIVSGVFWVGAMMFNAFFLGPSIAEAGPDGARVMRGLMQRNFMVIMPVVALLTILSGIWMMIRLGGGGDAFFHSTMGRVLSVGGLLAIIAFVIGMAVVRPAMMRAMALGQAAAQPGADQAALMPQIQALRARGAAATRLVTWLLILAVAAMATARYA